MQLLGQRHKSHWPTGCLYEAVRLLYIYRTFTVRLIDLEETQFERKDSYSGTWRSAVNTAMCVQPLRWRPCRLRPLDGWDRGLESSWVTEYSSLQFVVLCCVGSGHCDGLITGLEESYRVFVSMCVSVFVFMCVCVSVCVCVYVCVCV